MSLVSALLSKATSGPVTTTHIMPKEPLTQLNNHDDLSDNMKGPVKFHA
jgi:hypothetical protein